MRNQLVFSRSFTSLLLIFVMGVGFASNVNAQNSNDCSNEQLAAAGQQAVAAKQAAVDNSPNLQAAALSRQLMQQCMSSLSATIGPMVALAGTGGPGAYLSGLTQRLDSAACSQINSRASQAISSIQSAAVTAANNATGGALSSVNGQVGAVLSPLGLSTSTFVPGGIPSASGLITQGANAAGAGNPSAALDTLQNFANPTTPATGTPAPSFLDTAKNFFSPATPAPAATAFPVVPN